MNLLDWQALSQQLVVTFGHFLWQGTLAGIAFALVLRCLSQRSAHARYLAATSAFALLPIAVLLTFVWVNSAGEPIVVAQFTVVRESPAERTPPIALPVMPSQEPASESVATTVITPTTPTSPPIDWSQILPAMSPYIVGMYGLGVIALLSRCSLSIWASGRLRLAIQPITDAAISRLIGVQSARMGLRRVPIVALCQRACVPLVVGILKPTILLPPAIICGLDTQQLAAILSHELAHISRHDLLFNLMQRVVEALLFFHPVTWWISRQISMERENCCDDLASAERGRLSYAGALLQMAELCARSRGLNIAPQLAALAADGGNASQLSHRIRRLLGEVETPRLALTKLPTIVGVMLPLVLSLSLVGYAQIAAKSESEHAQVPAKEASLEEDHIQWGQSVQGLRLGARFVDAKDSQATRFKNSDLARVQLFVQNTTDAPITGKFMLDHVYDEWGSTIANDRGAGVSAARIIVWMFVPPRYFTTTLAPGEIVQLTGQTADDDKRQAVASFRIEPKPEPAKVIPPFVYAMPSGRYTANYWTSFVPQGKTVKESIVLKAAPLRFLVGDAEDTWPVAAPDPTVDENQPKATDDQGPAPPDSGTPVPEVKPEKDEAATRSIRYKLVDGMTDTPLQGIEVTFGAWSKVPADAPKFTPALARLVGSTKSDASGVAEVKLRAGEKPFLNAAPAGWFLTPQTFVVEQDKQKTTVTVVPPGLPDPKDQEPHLVKLWPGTEVVGRLLWPDGSPAAGVRLNAGVYIHNQEWKKRLGMDLTFYSFDHGDWANWSYPVVTDKDGKFSVTVPPPDARAWLRIGNTSLSFAAINADDKDDAIARKLAKCIPLEVQFGGFFSSNLLRVDAVPVESDERLQMGDLKLQTGVIVRGRVLDAAGNGLSGVHLTTTGAHGPHSGRSAISGEDGKFEFHAMAPGNLIVHPDARLRNDKRQVISREVQAVFVDQSFTIPAGEKPVEITIGAVASTEVVFNWDDRRADKTQPVAYYGAFRVRGFMPNIEGQPGAYWTSETERVERDGKTLLVVTVPTALLKPELILSADRMSTASYSDSTGLTSGPGVVELGDVTKKDTRTIHGDEPKPRK